SRITVSRIHVFTTLEDTSPPDRSGAELVADCIDSSVESLAACAFTVVKQVSLNCLTSGQPCGPDSQHAYRQHVAFDTAFQQCLERLPKRFGGVGGLGQSLGPVPGAKVGGANLHFNRTRHQAGVTEPCAQMIGQVKQPGAQHLPIADVMGKSSLGTD